MKLHLIYFFFSFPLPSLVSAATNAACHAAHSRFVRLASHISNAAKGPLSELAEGSFGVVSNKGRFSGQIVHLRTLSKKLLFMDVVISTIPPGSTICLPGDTIEAVATARDGHSEASISALAREVRIS